MDEEKPWQTNWVSLEKIKNIYVNKWWQTPASQWNDVVIHSYNAHRTQFNIRDYAVNSCRWHTLKTTQIQNENIPNKKPLFRLCISHVIRIYWCQLFTFDKNLLLDSHRPRICQLCAYLTMFTSKYAISESRFYGRTCDSLCQW